MRDVSGATSAKAADVYKAGVPAATLTRTPQGVSFAYRAGYEGPPVAITLPVSAEPVRAPAGAVPPFFSGLLPEGRRLWALRRAVKTSADDELSLLVAVGADPVGNVRMIAVPVSSPSGHHLLKLSPPEFPHLVANEAFFLEAARRSGLRVAVTTVVWDADGIEGLLFTRFDRSVVDGTVVCRAQEDACQLLGRYPADKYVVSSEHVAAAIAAPTAPPLVALRDVFEQLAFAYMTGNGDMHAKNLSVGTDALGEWRVTPAYDLPSSYPYGDTTMALDIQGRKREDITRTTMLAFADAIGLRRRAAEAVLDKLIESVDAWLVDLAILPFDDRTLHKLRRVILGRRRKLGVTQ